MSSVELEEFIKLELLDGVAMKPARCGAYDLKYPAALNGPQFLSGSILKQPFEVKDGAIEVPVGHGLGVEVDEAKLRELLVKEI